MAKAPAGKRRAKASKRGDSAKKATGTKKAPSSAKPFFLKTHVSRFSTVVAVCDRQCLGKKYESGGLILDLATHRRFYDGEPASEAEVVEALSSSGNINIVGDKAVGVACASLGLSKAGAKRIGGVAHLQIYKV